MKKITFNKLTWIDIEDPKEKDLESLKKIVVLHPSTIHQFLPPLKRSKVEVFENYLFIVFHFPVFSRITRCTTPEELDIILTKDTLVTSHRGKLPELSKFFKNCLLHQPLRVRFFKKTISHLLFHLLDKLIDSCLPMLDHIAENIDKIESQVFEGKEKKMVGEISVVKRDIINFKKAIRAQEAILELLATKLADFFPKEKEVKFYSHELIDSQGEVNRILANHKDLIHTLDSTNQSLLSYKTGNIMRILTVISFITFPLAVIAGIFGMNVFRNFPFVNNPLTFWIILLSMAVTVVVMIIYFRKKKWL